MNNQMKDVLPSLGITILMLLVLEILTTALLPFFGLIKFTIPFNILIVLYMGFKLESPYISIFILITQFFHSFFSIEGWEMGTVAGIIICVIISYLKDLIHFSSAAITIFVTQIFQFVWFLIVSSLIYVKMGTFSFVIEKFWRFIPESIIISLLAPFFFALLDRVWKVGHEGMLGDHG